METVLAIFADIDDPRDDTAQYELAGLLFIALAATLCGVRSCVDIADFAAANRADLAEFVDLPADATPSHDTFSRMFRLLDPAHLEPAGQPDPGRRIGSDLHQPKNSADNHPENSPADRRVYDALGGCEVAAVVNRIAGRLHWRAFRRFIRRFRGRHRAIMIKWSPKHPDQRWVCILDAAGATPVVLDVTRVIRPPVNLLDHTTSGKVNTPEKPV